jgi:hypothetical protein
MASDPTSFLARRGRFAPDPEAQPPQTSIPTDQTEIATIKRAKGNLDARVHNWLHGHPRNPDEFSAAPSDWKIRDGAEIPRFRQSKCADADAVSVCETQCLCHDVEPTPTWRKTLSRATLKLSKMCGSAEMV